MSEEETVSREWEGRKVRWKRFFPTWKQDRGRIKISFPLMCNQTDCCDQAAGSDILTSASHRFSGLTRTLLEMASRTSAVLEFSLLTLTKN